MSGSPAVAQRRWCGWLCESVNHLSKTPQTPQSFFYYKFHCLVLQFPRWEIGVTQSILFMGELRGTRPLCTHMHVYKHTCRCLHMHPHVCTQSEFIGVSRLTMSPSLMWERPLRLRWPVAMATGLATIYFSVHSLEPALPVELLVRKRFTHRKLQYFHNKQRELVVTCLKSRRWLNTEHSQQSIKEDLFLINKSIMLMMKNVFKFKQK